MTKPLFKEFIILLILVAGLHLLAIYFDLYWTVSKFDSMMHFLGGASVVLGILWLYFFSGFFNPQKRQIWQFLSVSFLGLVFVSVSWEVYELMAGVTFVSGQEYPFDTSLDFSMDLLGGATACLYAYMKEISNVNLLLTVKGQAPDNLPV